ncbi:UNVERIFIED_CONTAM: hypothetical protein C7383_111129 [Murimonas intestini]|uniref:Type 4 fimbrial biogenesis protein PilX N-terminal domain-containing protein n=2 Tax=Murimonas intestini TaxID=1337051 RepID=A0AB73T109_9FIRM
MNVYSLKNCCRKDRNKGAAMIVVLCIMAVLMALSLAVLLSASVVMGNAQKAATREQCRLTAITFSEALEEKLTEDYDDPTFKVENEGIRTYLREAISSKQWLYYNEAEAGHNSKKAVTRSFTVENLPSDSAYGDIAVDMYWESDGTVAIDDEELRYSNSILVVVVTCSYKGQTQKVKSQYALKCQYEESVDKNEGETAPVSWKWQRMWRE